MYTVSVTDNNEDWYGVYAIYTDSKGLADSPWPKFQHDNQNSGNYNHKK